MEEIPKSYGVTTISTTISRTLWEKARHHNIMWSEALRRGVTTILAEKGDEDYLNPLQQSRKIAALVDKIEQLVQENEKLRMVQNENICDFKKWTL